MAEGGRFPWKMQRIFSRGPAADYKGIRKPLPQPPEGLVWRQNKETKEWSLEPEVEAQIVVPAATAEEQKQAASAATPAFIPEVAAMPAPDSSQTTTKTVPISNHHSKDTIDVMATSGADFAVPPVASAVILSEADWEVLSDRVSSCGGSVGFATNGVLVPRAGSVRSLGAEDEHTSHSTANISFPMKIQRTTSSSTIDSTDNALGPSGKGVLGVDYVEHVILPTDTLQGICLAYKITSTRLRQANHFSGNSLQLAPKKLVIPLSKKALRSGFIRVQDTDSKEYKIHAFQAEFPDMCLTEAKAYLELANWILDDAVTSAKEDGEWEKAVQGDAALRAGEIQIKVNIQKGGLGFQTKGAGLPPTAPKLFQQTPSAPTKKPLKVYDGVPAEATKTVQAEDVYNAAPQHNGFGLELQPLASQKNGALA